MAVSSPPSTPAPGSQTQAHAQRHELLHGDATRDEGPTHRENPIHDDIVVQHELVIAANRLPVRRSDDGDWALSPGGLVTAMAPVMAAQPGGWIGWGGTSETRDARPSGTDAPNDSFVHGDMTLHPITLSPTEHAAYYEGFSNATLWPLYHNGLLPTRFKRSWWSAYRRVNKRFADRAIATTAPGGTLWVHDYHLQLVPAMVRAARPDIRIGFFLHTSFPPSQLIMRLPWRTEITEGLLGADVIGFQTRADARNFMALTSRVAGVEEEIIDDFITIDYDDRSVVIGTHPISIDVDKVEALATAAIAMGAVSDFRTSVGNPKTVILGIDRLDYTKGIDARLKAFQELLKDGYLDPTEVLFVQVATPTRDNVPGYEDMRAEIERLVGQINGDYSSLSRPIVHYLHTTLPFEELIPLYLAADVMAVTPYQDGMNLVAKEFVASRVDHRGVLLLSEFAGTADEFPDAVTCNPFDIAGVKQSLRAALSISPDEQAERIGRMRRHLADHDVHHWARGFLATLDDRSGGTSKT